jgi:predicted amidohydrolase YtcJ
VFTFFSSWFCILPGSHQKVNRRSGILSPRQDEKGWPNGGWFPQQRMTREEAIKGFTIWAAYAAFQEKVLGSIEIGKLADFTVLDRDILTIAPKEILQTNVVYTIVGGKIRYQRQ